MTAMRWVLTGTLIPQMLKTKSVDLHTYSFKSTPADGPFKLSNPLILGRIKVVVVSLDTLVSDEMNAGEPWRLGDCLELFTKQLSLPIISNSGVLQKLFGVPSLGDARSIVV